MTSSQRGAVTGATWLIGLGTVLSRVHEYRARFGDYWEPAPLLEKLVRNGQRLFEDS